MSDDSDGLTSAVLIGLVFFIRAGTQSIAMDDHPRDRIALMSSVEVEMWKELQSTSVNAKMPCASVLQQPPLTTFFNRRPTDEQRMMSHATTNRQCRLRFSTIGGFLTLRSPGPWTAWPSGRGPSLTTKSVPKFPTRMESQPMKGGGLEWTVTMPWSNRKLRVTYASKKCLATPRQVWAAVASPLCLSRPVYEALDPVCLA